MPKTDIEWADYSWNPLRVKGGGHGCTKVSEGCRFCYAEVLNRRFGNKRKFTGTWDFVLDEKTLREPEKWPGAKTVFVESMGDLFHNDVRVRMIDRVFDVMARNGQHTFMVLTKRPKRMLLYMWSRKRRRLRTGTPLPNVILGTSVEGEGNSFTRIVELTDCVAARRFLSCEPLLGPIDLDDLVCWCGDRPNVDLVIVGGESGPHGRPMNPLWARMIRDHCIDNDIPFFFKQWGTWRPIRVSEKIPPKKTNWHRFPGDYLVPGTMLPSTRLLPGVIMLRGSKKANGRHLDGRLWNEKPRVLVNA